MARHRTLSPIPEAWSYLIGLSLVPNIVRHPYKKDPKGDPILETALLGDCCKKPTNESCTLTGRTKISRMLPC